MMKNSVMSVLAGLFCLSLICMDSPIQAATYTVQVQSNVVYGKGQINSGAASKDLLLDVYTPIGLNDPAKPAIVMLHGGGWSAGHFQYPPVKDHAQYLAARGYVCFSVMYRLSGENPPTPGGSSMSRAMYAGYRDTKAAVRFIRANAATYGIDPTRIAGWGHSAGAYNVMAAAYSGSDEYLSDGPGDPHVAFNTPGVDSRPNAIIDLWGGITSGHLANMNSDSAPILIVHGTNDGLVNFSNATNLRDRAIAVGLPYDFYELTGQGHEPWTAMLGGVSIDDRTLQFLNQNMLTKVAATKKWDEFK